MNNLWFFDNVNLFNLLCPHKFKEYKKCHTFDAYKKVIISTLKRTQQVKCI